MSFSTSLQKHHDNLKEKQNLLWFCLGYCLGFAWLVLVWGFVLLGFFWVVSFLRGEMFVFFNCSFLFCFPVWECFLSSFWGFFLLGFWAGVVAVGICRGWFFQ